jgi:diguanylate cyclase (GGDEF)-like protein
MSADGGTDAARAGRRLKSKVLVALVLSSGVPVLVLLVVVPTLGSGVAQVLIAVTIASVLVGGWIIWDLGRILGRMGPLMASVDTLTILGRQQSQVDILMASYSKMLATIESQAEEINTFAARLDAAYAELESTNARLKEHTFKDDVTGLHNRRFLLWRLEEESQLGRPFSLVLIEFPGLRAVAERDGHEAYDHGLREVAAILTRAGGAVADVKSRYDGGRFAVLLLETRRPDAFRYVEEIRGAVVRDYVRAATPRMRAGVASRLRDGVTVEQLISEADTELRHDAAAR